jgi:chromosomal replication initiator protein
VYTTTALEVRKSEPELEDILRAVSEASGVSVEDIKGECRRKKIIAARQMYCYLARKAGKWSYWRIGNIIGKDHASAMHSCKEIKKMLETKEPEYTALANRLGIS